MCCYCDDYGYGQDYDNHHEQHYEYDYGHGYGYDKKSMTMPMSMTAAMILPMPMARDLAVPATNPMLRTVDMTVAKARTRAMILGVVIVCLCRRIAVSVW